MTKIFLLFSLLFATLLASQNTALIKDTITKAYSEHYKDYGIEISDIALNLPSNLSSQISPDYQIQSIDLDSKYLNKKNGTLLLNVSFKNSLLKIPATYQIKASIVVYRATTPIKKSQNITEANTQKDRVSLDKINQVPIKTSQINHISAKSYIPTNAIITLDKIQAKILIHKNDAFSATIKDKQISLETTLIAKENGTKDQIINAINPETQKIIRVKVTGEGKGEVL
ncbi:flagellar basal body P-ring formation chaperone FlgA [Helicobacter sp. 11S02596-1]|uniref:flagellar basal body P-ring formation chaperone FlgA n=1 Tax=Helicobacter sp. 11S02596-1 TaxID=1476194 RepID=UPI000BA5F663|nr:flagellar basal body P-ring formation chaperone FlgA [Helicobacter sp. 11S02596-1]PAF42471.1 flagella basal body P-ring formation protein FlgA [Helicobacter sp. 11S02596-1]